MKKQHNIKNKTEKNKNSKFGTKTKKLTSLAIGEKAGIVSLKCPLQYILAQTLKHHFLRCVGGGIVITIGDDNNDNTFFSFFE